MSTLQNLAWVPLSTAWLWAIVATVTAVIGLRASIRVADDNERIVVLRHGRPHRVRGPGPVLIVPVLDRGISVSVVPQRVGHRCVRGTTRDGGAITVELCLRYRITNPARAVTIHPDADDAVLALVEQAVEQRLCSTELSRIVRGPECWADRLTQELDTTSRSLGVAILGLEFTDVELQLPTGRADGPQ